jgi:type II secretory pathway pseudopilin PulG
MNWVHTLGGIAAILLVIEVMVVVIIVGAIVYIIRRGLIAGRKAAEPYVEQATVQVQRVETLTKEYANAIVTAEAQAIATFGGLRRGIDVLFDRD